MKGLIVSSTLSPCFSEQQEELLSLDLDINAQGLEVWMQRQEKAAS
jgi:hypothetical protein